MSKKPTFGRREFLKTAAAAAGVVGLPDFALAQAAKIKIGLMLPYTGTYAQLGVAITNGFKLAVAENGGKLGGRELEYFTVDDESDPGKATDNANKLVTRDKVDVLIGTVHSGVEMGIVKIARESGVLHINPNAGAAAATGALCAPNIFRTSFTNWQPAYPMGKVLADRGIKKVVTLTHKYAAGDEAIEGHGLAQAHGVVALDGLDPILRLDRIEPAAEQVAARNPQPFIRTGPGQAQLQIQDGHNLSAPPSGVHRQRIRVVALLVVGPEFAGHETGCALAIQRQAATQESLAFQAESRADPVETNVGGHGLKPVVLEQRAEFLI